MRSFGWAPLTLSLSLLATAANANIRAPVMHDGSFSEHMRGAHPSALLLRERFVARLPSLVAGAGDGFAQARALRARVEVEYDIENTSSEVVTIPVRFLAVGASAASIFINDTETPHRAIADADERLAARKHIARHRCAWSGARLHPGDCSAIDDNAKRVDERFARAHRGADDLPVDALAFDVTLRPGTSTVRVAYDQGLQFREGAYGYFSGLGIRGAHYGFEYLLYPAETWRRGDDFTFDVFIDVPDVRERGWFGDSFLPSTVFTNLPIDPVRQPHPGTTVSGRLRDFPSEVLAVVVVVP